MVKNSLAAGASPRTLLGSLQRCPPPSWSEGRKEEGEERGVGNRSGGVKEGRKGKRRIKEGRTGLEGVAWCGVASVPRSASARIDVL